MKLHYVGKNFFLKLKCCHLQRLIEKYINLSKLYIFLFIDSQCLINFTHEIFHAQQQKQKEKKVYDENIFLLNNCTCCLFALSSVLIKINTRLPYSRNDQQEKLIECPFRS